MTDVMKGIRVLEVAEHTFVPAASAVLADWGADVIKIEHAVRGDAMRGLGRTGVMDLSKGVHVLNEHSNRGKRSLGLDLSHPEGLEVLYALAKTSDVFLTNKLPGTLARLRIDVPDIRAQNPKIVYARGTSFGPKGAEKDRGGYDMTGFWCRGGSASAVGVLYACSQQSIGQESSLEITIENNGRSWRFDFWISDSGAGADAFRDGEAVATCQVEVLTLDADCEA